MAGATPSPRDGALRRAATALSILDLIAERLATLARPPAAGEALVLRRHAAELVALAGAEIRSARADAAASPPVVRTAKRSVRTGVRTPPPVPAAAPPPVVRTPERSVRTPVRTPAPAPPRPDAPSARGESTGESRGELFTLVHPPPPQPPPPPPPLRVPLAKRRGRRPGTGAMAVAAAERREADLQRVAAATLPPGVADAAKLHLQRRGDGVTGAAGAWSVNGRDPIDDAALLERARRHGFDPAGVRPVLRVLAAE